MEKIKINCIECEKPLREFEDSKFARKLKEIAICEDCMIELSKGDSHEM